MSRIILFSGTSEGRQLSEALEKAGTEHVVCVATRTGAEVMQEESHARIHEGRLDLAEMEELVRSEGAEILVDATHPYATEVSKTIRDCAANLSAEYLRVLRESTDWENNWENDWEKDGSSAGGKDGSSAGEKDGSNAGGKDGSNAGEGGHVRYFPDALSCRQALSETEGNILLTTGSKQLSFFGEEECLKERLFARVLPTSESLRLCEAAGIGVKNVIAMFGPFSEDMNSAMLSQYHIRVMVTKESGRAGGFPEKMRAARKAGCDVFVIGRPSREEGISWEEAAAVLTGGSAAGSSTNGSSTIGSSTTDSSTTGSSIAVSSCTGNEPFVIRIAVVGIGMGDRDTLTVGGAEAIEAADMILGAERMIAPFRKKYPEKKFVQEYLSGKILDAIRQEAARAAECQADTGKVNACRTNANHANAGGELRAAVLYSGDCGFFSGAVSFRKALDEWKDRGNFEIRVRQYAGISSFSYFSAALGISYSEAALETWHGHSDDPYYERQLIKSVRRKEKTFLLLSGIKDVNRLGHVLQENDLGECEIFLGYQLGSPEENVFSVTPSQAEALEQEGLYIAMIRNPEPGKDPVIRVMKDEEFLRDKTPMTKEEIRHLSILKLGLTENAVFYDIGAGTGSVSCEAAGLHPGIRVYAIEQKETAASLMEKNIENLRLSNITLIRGKAPDAMEGLPAPTHAFIGGSSGQLLGILEALREKCPGIRVVVNAISLETLGEIMACAKQMEFSPEMVQIQASRSHEVGAYHLVKAENPIWIAAFNL